MSVCEAVQDVPRGAFARRWTLRADNHNHHHGVVNGAENPLYLALNWRLSSDDLVHEVGTFRLDLDDLLNSGYVRYEPADSNGPEVRLRIVRADDGCFYVQANKHGPRLLLADRSDE